MKTHAPKNPRQRKKAEQQCPICGTVAHPSVVQKTNLRQNIFNRYYSSLFKQYSCRGCSYTFSTSIVANYFWKYFRPLLIPLFPRLALVKAHARVGELVYAPQKPYMPTRPNKINNYKRKANKPIVRASTSRGGIPFTIDPIKKTVSMNFQCPLGDREFGSQMEAAVYALEIHLRLAANQIRELVNNQKSPPRSENSAAKNKGNNSKRPSA